MDLIIFEQDRPFILQSLRSGDFDYVEAANEAAEADFFRDLFKRKVISDLAGSYPTPRQKEEVPFYGFCQAPKRLSSIQSGIVLRN